ncbi:MAG: D-alanyl-D-alanine carboxypeptidase family protein [Pseudomonadota bacterium]
MRFLLSAFLLCCLILPKAALSQQDTPARAAIVMDLNSGAILLEKDPDLPLPPASMSKLMTLNMVFEALQAGRIALDDKFRTSARAASMGGSKMFIRDGELVSVEDLLKGVVIQSGNDAAVALAEAMLGTEEAFAQRMNERAPEIGLTASTFANSTGWPHPDQKMSVRDLATLSARLVTEFPEYYQMFEETEFTWDGITQPNRNPLLDLGIGADGLKTGHTEEAGYGLAASAKRGDRRIVVVVTGLDSAAQRKQETERLITWAFRAFEAKALYTAGQEIAEVPVWIGGEVSVPIAPARDITLLVPAGTLADTKLTVTHRSPATAPIASGDKLGLLTIEARGMPPVTVPLIATQDVAEGGILERMQAAAHLLLSGVLPAGDG